MKTPFVDNADQSAVLAVNMGKLVLPSGATGFINEAGQWQCTGSQMGRRDTVPEGFNGRLRLVRLPFVDGSYDRWGAYWGSPGNVWIAFSGPSLWCQVQGFARRRVMVMDFEACCYVRANDRSAAKLAVLKTFPGATFYR